VNNFEHSQAQDVAVYGGYAGEAVVFGEARDEFVDAFLVEADALDE